MTTDLTTSEFIEQLIDDEENIRVDGRDNEYVVIWHPECWKMLKRRVDRSRKLNRTGKFKGLRLKRWND